MPGKGRDVSGHDVRLDLYRPLGGEPTPSCEDRKLTLRLQRAGKILGIEVLDHVIVAAGRFWSFKEQGELYLKGRQLGELTGSSVSVRRGER